MKKLWSLFLSACFVVTIVFVPFVPAFLLSKAPVDQLLMGEQTSKWLIANPDIKYQLYSYWFALVYLLIVVGMISAQRMTKTRIGGKWVLFTAVASILVLNFGKRQVNFSHYWNVISLFSSFTRNYTQLLEPLQWFIATVGAIGIVGNSYLLLQSLRRLKKWQSIKLPLSH